MVLSSPLRDELRTLTHTTTGGSAASGGRPGGGAGGLRLLQKLTDTRTQREPGAWERLFPLSLTPGASAGYPGDAGGIRCYARDIRRDIPDALGTPKASSNTRSSDPVHV